MFNATDFHDNITIMHMTTEPFTETGTGNSSSAVTRNEYLAYFEIGILAAIFCIALIGNSMVFVVLLWRRKTLTRMHVLMLHLSFADLCVAFFNVLPQLIWDITYLFRGGNLLCKAVKYLQVVVIYSSSYVLVSTAIDRYVAIRHPLTSHKFSSKKVHYLVGVAWTLAFLLGMPQMFIFSYTEISTGVYNCWATFDPEWTLQVYITFNTLTVFVVPVVILALCYGSICYTVWRRGRIGEAVTTTAHAHKISLSTIDHSREPSLCRSLYTGSGNSDTKVKAARNCRIPRAKIRTIQLTLTVVCCFVVCWSPFYVGQMWAAFDPNAPFMSDAYTIILLLASLNSCTNPWIYLIFSGNYRKWTILQHPVFFCCRKRRRRTRSRSSHESTMETEMVSS